MPQGIGVQLSTIVLDSAVIEAAARGIGITDRAGLDAHLGVDISRPVTMLMVAAVLSRLPVALDAAFRVKRADSEPHVYLGQR